MAEKLQRVLILGAAGRDFHDFNVFWRDHSQYEVVGFTAAQIPDIDKRSFPSKLAGPKYPHGLPIFSEDRLEQLIKEMEVDLCTLSYSDLPYEEVMHKAARAASAGASFMLLGPDQTQLKSSKPVIAVCATRTGCGKSQTTRYLAAILRKMGLRVAAVRHPMPYGGDLTKQVCQRFETLEDLDRYECTIEEREEYEPHIQAGNLVFAGVDYQQILDAAEKEADVILWDGGNNDVPFYKPTLWITVADPHRAGHESRYYPSEINVRRADAIVLNTLDSASPDQFEVLRKSIASLNPSAHTIDAESPLTVDDPAAIRGKRVLCIEDGPTVTHGEMRYGAGYLAAKAFGAAEMVDPRPAAQGSLKDTFAKYTHLENVLPAMGYGAQQVHDLEETIRAVDCDLVLVGTPIDLTRVVTIDKANMRVRYDLKERNPGELETLVAKAVKGVPAIA